ncbi:MFS transporter [Shimazuella kribbensis]|uniref:MFS transporter n=1 Tax=Shimazuella kribbensis TaxID=139808 RepID=UPI00041A2A7A|nr:MFS transporter [Shimazuella kribbensis]
MKHRQHGDKLLLILMFTLIISAMSALMFNFTLTDISKEYHITTAQVSWVTSIYGLIYGIGTVFYGKMADQYRLKNLITFGLLFFTVGSLIGLGSTSFWMVLAARSVQALGASVIPAISMLIPIRYFAPENRGVATGTIVVGLSLGNALGPIISALIVEFTHWRWLFFIPVFIVIVIPFYRKYLDDEQLLKNRKTDWIGGFMLSLTVTSILLWITNGSWWYSLIGCVTLLLFIVRIHKSSNPFIQPVLFRNKDYVVGLGISFLVNGMCTAIYFVIPLLLANVQQLQAGWIGFVMVPAAAVSALLGRYGGKIVDTKGNKPLFTIASCLLMVFFGAISILIGSSPYVIAILLIFGFLGQSYMMLSISNSISRTLPYDQVGVGMGFLMMLNFIAGSIGTGIYAKIVDIDAKVAIIPIQLYGPSIIYSNIFTLLVLLQLVTLMIYYLSQYVFQKRKVSHL